jgi:hypothetical protein
MMKLTSSIIVGFLLAAHGCAASKPKRHLRDNTPRRLTDATEVGDYCYGYCTGTGAGRTCSFTFSYDPFASAFGYFSVAGCSGIQPHLVMEAGVEYTFYQVLSRAAANTSLLLILKTV